MGRKKDLNKLRKRTNHNNQAGDRGARGNTGAIGSNKASSTAGNGQGARLLCVCVYVCMCGFGKWEGAYALFPLCCTAAELGASLC